MVRGDRCYYCSACWNICPVGAIKIIRDKKRFKRIVVDNNLCIGCKRCEEVCPILLNSGDLKNPVKYYAGYHKSIKQNMISASGGFAHALSEKYLRMGGYVCGCAWSRGFKSAHHIVICRSEELIQLTGSKYVQSDKGDCFNKIKELLKKGNKVLFIGTPCETAGLSSFLNMKHPNLLLVDLICQGTTTDEILSQYIESISNGKTIRSMDLRYQDYFNKDPERYCVRIQFDDMKIKKELFSESIYGYGFFKYKREECYDCCFKGKSSADITIGDCWGINKKYDFFSSYGTSVIIANSQKGIEEIETLTNFNAWEVDKSILEGNRRYYSPVDPDSDIEEFTDSFIKNGLQQAVLQTRSVNPMHVISKFIPWKVKKILGIVGKQVLPYDSSKKYRKI